MSRSLATLKALLPPGRAWTRAVGTVLHKLLEAIAQEFDRLEARANDLLREAVPTGADELLPEWEAITDATRCVEGASIEARRAGVVSRLLSGTPTEALTVSTIEGMGYPTPTITYWSPFVVGGSEVGDALSNDEWQHAIGIATVTRTPEDDAALRCVVDDLQHLHVIVVWNLEGAGSLLTEDGFELLTEDGLALLAE